MTRSLSFTLSLTLSLKDIQYLFALLSLKYITCSLSSLCEVQYLLALSSLCVKYSTCSPSSL